jgi:hypothetical protein
MIGGVLTLALWQTVSGETAMLCSSGELDVTAIGWKAKSTRAMQHKVCLDDDSVYPSWMGCDEYCGYREKGYWTASESHAHACFSRGGTYVVENDKHGRCKGVGPSRSAPNKHNPGRKALLNVALGLMLAFGTMQAGFPVAAPIGVLFIFGVIQPISATDSHKHPHLQHKPTGLKEALHNWEKPSSHPIAPELVAEHDALLLKNKVKPTKSVHDGSVSSGYGDKKAEVRSTSHHSKNHDKHNPVVPDHSIHDDVDHHKVPHAKSLPDMNIKPHGSRKSGKSNRGEPDDDTMFKHSGTIYQFDTKATKGFYKWLRSEQVYPRIWIILAAIASWYAIIDLGIHPLLVAAAIVLGWGVIGAEAARGAYVVDPHPCDYPLMHGLSFTLGASGMLFILGTFLGFPAMWCVMLLVVGPFLIPDVC